MSPWIRRLVLSVLAILMQDSCGGDHAIAQGMDRFLAGMIEESFKPFDRACSRVRPLPLAARHRCTT